MSQGVQTWQNKSLRSMNKRYIYADGIEKNRKMAKFIFVLSTLAVLACAQWSNNNQGGFGGKQSGAVDQQNGFGQNQQNSFGGQQNGIGNQQNGFGQQQSGSNTNQFQPQKRGSRPTGPPPTVKPPGTPPTGPPPSEQGFFSSLMQRFKRNVVGERQRPTGAPRPHPTSAPPARAPGIPEMWGQRKERSPRNGSPPSGSPPTGTPPPRSNGPPRPDGPPRPSGSPPTGSPPPRPSGSPPTGSPPTGRPGPPPQGRFI